MYSDFDILCTKFMLIVDGEVHDNARAFNTLLKSTVKSVVTGQPVTSHSVLK